MQPGIIKIENNSRLLLQSVIQMLRYKRKVERSQAKETQMQKFINAETVAFLMSAGLVVLGTVVTVIGIAMMGS